MPNLNIKGSLLDDFGRYLPTPIIDKIIVENDQLKVDISLYFNFTEMDIAQEDIDNYITSLSTNNLYVYVSWILGDEHVANVLEQENIQIFGELYNGDNYYLSSGAGAGTAVFLQSTTPNYKQVHFDTTNFAASTEKYYSENDERIVQFGGTIELPVTFFADTRGWDGQEHPTHNIGVQTTGLNDNVFQAPIRLPPSLSDMSICAFTSWIDLDTPATATNPQMVTSQLSDKALGETSRNFERKIPALMPLLGHQQVSNISYESVFKEGMIDTGAQLSYVDGDGATYNKTPIQAINGKLYKQDAYTLEQIRALFTSYVAKSPAEDNEVQSIMDNISYVVSTYGKTSELLIQLNILRKTFPDKSSATSVGRFYEGFKSRFFGANEKVASATSVVEQLYKSSKIVDGRLTVEGAVGTLKEEQDPTTWNFIYPYQAGAPANWGSGPADFIEGSWMTSVVVFKQDDSGTGAATQKQFIRTGFWFFDYRLALRQYAQACTVLSYDALKEFVGRDQLNRYFTIQDATVTKWRLIRQGKRDQWGDSSSQYTRLARFKTGISTKEITIQTPQTETRQAPISSTCEVEDTDSAPDFMPEESWLQLRGIAGTDISDVHKLVGFQFQDMEGEYDGNNNPIADTSDELITYSFSITLKDDTRDVLGHLYQTLNDYFTGEFEQYYQLATENCSFNSLDGTFNDFFSEGIMAHYGTDTSSYPWYRMPVLLNLHKQLLVGEFANDDKLQENATMIASNINPINGNLSSLEAFKANCQTFIDDYYGQGSTVYNLIQNTDDVIITIGDDMNNLIMARPPAPIATIDSTWEFTDTSQETGEYGRNWGSLWTDDFLYASFEHDVQTGNVVQTSTESASEAATEINSKLNTFFNFINTYIALGHNLDGVFDSLFKGWNSSSSSEQSSFIKGEAVEFEFENDTVTVNADGEPPSFDSFVDIVFLHLFGHAWDTGGNSAVAYNWLRAMSSMMSGISHNYLAEFAYVNGYGGPVDSDSVADAESPGDWISATDQGDIVVTPFVQSSGTVQAPFDSPVGMKWMVGLRQTEELYLRLEQLWIDLGGRRWGCNDAVSNCTYSTVATTSADEAVVQEIGAATD